MTTDILNQKSSVSLQAARISMIAVIVYQVILIALLFIRPDLDPYWHPISEWALGPNGWIMIMAFLISGLSYGSMAVAVQPHVSGGLGKIGLVILCICAIGTVGVGVFVTDPMYEVTDTNPPPISLSTTGMLHIMCGSSALLLLPFAALLINTNLAIKNEKWRYVKTILYLTGSLPLLGWIGFISHTVLILLPMGPYAYGPDVPLGYPARLLLLTYMVWLVSLARIIKQVNTGKLN